MMTKRCMYCKKEMGPVGGPEDTGYSDGYCDDCFEAAEAESLSEEDLTRIDLDPTLLVLYCYLGAQDVPVVTLRGRFYVPGEYSYRLTGKATYREHKSPVYVEKEGLEILVCGDPVGTLADVVRRVRGDMGGDR